MVEHNVSVSETNSGLKVSALDSGSSSRGGGGGTGSILDGAFQWCLYSAQISLSSPTTIFKEKTFPARF